MRRGEIILHVCLHGSYHRGNAGIVLQKNGITPTDDRVTDFLETATRTNATAHNQLRRQMRVAVAKGLAREVRAVALRKERRVFA